MKVSGYNESYRLGGSLNNNNSNTQDIKFPGQSCLDISLLLSFSTYQHSVWINQKGEAFAVGDNSNGKISSELQKEKFETDTKIDFRLKNGQPCKFISAVAGRSYTLYQVAGEKSNDPSQLILAYTNKETIFVNIGKRSPLSLYGGNYTSAVIDTEGSVIIITKSVFDSPDSEVECLSLPNHEKAVKVACCDFEVVALSESGRVFYCFLKEENRSFSEVVELQGTKINEITGTSKHFFAISDNGKVFGRGSNNDNKLGMPSDIKRVDKFIVVESLNMYNIVEASAGVNDSLFRTSEGKVIGCGWNEHFELMLKNENKKKVFPPEETLITCGATFCISGGFTSVVFVGVMPPVNTPNRKIEFLTSYQENLI